jgi:hypothetical protein
MINNNVKISNVYLVEREDESEQWIVQNREGGGCGIISDIIPQFVWKKRRIPKLSYNGPRASLKYNLEFFINLRG